MCSLSGLVLRRSGQLVVRHGHNGEDEVDEIEGADENVDHEEEDVPRSGRPQRDLVEVLPKVLSHQAKRAKVR